MVRSIPPDIPPQALDPASSDADADDDDDDDLEERFAEPPRRIAISITSPPSPTEMRRAAQHNTPAGFSGVDFGARFRRQQSQPETTDERSGLLAHRGDVHRSYAALPAPPRPDGFFRQNSAAGTVRRHRHHSRTNSQATHFGHGYTGGLDRSLSDSGHFSTRESTGGSFSDGRVWYDQFTSTDWLHDSIADGIRLRELRSRRDIRGRLLAWLDGAQGWVLAGVIGVITACFAYFVDVTETAIFDLKEGFCSSSWFVSKNRCCLTEEGEQCPAWRSWSKVIESSGIDDVWIDFTAFVLWAVILAAASCALTLLTKTVVPSSIPLSTLDEDLAAEPATVEDSSHSRAYKKSISGIDALSPERLQQPLPPVVYYSAAGSGVAEVKVILSGFVLHGYLGFKTLIIKTLGLVLSVASGLSVGKEGPYVHIAAAIGNICCRIFPKYHQNDGKRREMLSASAASGVGVAFGAPIGGVLFSLEEVSYYFPPKTLFRTFFCCIAAALSLKFLNPYGTGKIVPFQVKYLSDWEIFELAIFMILGVLGGAAGAFFIKASQLWAQTFRRISVIKRWPMLEVVLVSLITGLVSFWNRYTKLAVSELLGELASPCDNDAETRTGLCPTKDEIPEVILYLFIAFIVKGLLTTITFGIKVPSGIYVPSMVVGGLMGRTVGHIAQYFVVHYPHFFLFGKCPVVRNPQSCVNPGVYALIAAGSTMCGVTRLSVTLVVILFELTGSLDHVLPFSLAILCAKWTANALEPRSIYDLLTDMNSYPFLDNKLHPISDIQLGDLIARPRKGRIIDVTDSPLIPAIELRDKLATLLMSGEVDGGLPVLRNKVLVGLISAPELEYALDKLENEEDTLCLVDPRTSGAGPRAAAAAAEDGNVTPSPTDFTQYIDPAPVALDVNSPINVVYECFVKLGLRYICALRDGKYAGLVHKKSFVKFMKDSEERRQ